MVLGVVTMTNSHSTFLPIIIARKTESKPAVSKSLPNRLKTVSFLHTCILCSLEENITLQTLYEIQVRVSDLIIKFSFRLQRNRKNEKNSIPQKQRTYFRDLDQP